MTCFFQKEKKNTNVISINQGLWENCDPSFPFASSFLVVHPPVDISL